MSKALPSRVKTTQSTNRNRSTTSQTVHTQPTQPTNSTHIQPTKLLTSKEDPFQVVYNIQTSTFRLERISVLLSPPAPTVHTAATPTDEERDANPHTLLSPTIKSPALSPTPTLGVLTQPQMPKRESPRTKNAGKTTAPGSLSLKSTLLRSPQQRIHSSHSLSSLPSTTINHIQSISPTQETGSPQTRQDLTPARIMEIPGNMPPLLVDGKMLIVQIPKWKRKVDFCWRRGARGGEAVEGNSVVLIRKVKLPLWIWCGRNFGRGIKFEKEDGNGIQNRKGRIVKGRWMEMWIERV